MNPDAYDEIPDFLLNPRERSRSKGSLRSAGSKGNKRKRKDSEDFDLSIKNSKMYKKDGHYYYKKNNTQKKEEEIMSSRSEVKKNNYNQEKNLDKWSKSYVQNTKNQNHEGRLPFKNNSKDASNKWLKKNKHNLFDNVKSPQEKFNERNGNGNDQQYIKDDGREVYQYLQKLKLDENFGNEKNSDHIQEINDSKKWNFLRLSAEKEEIKNKRQSEQKADTHPVENINQMIFNIEEKSHSSEEEISQMKNEMPKGVIFNDESNTPEIQCQPKEGKSYNDLLKIIQLLEEEKNNLTMKNNNWIEEKKMMNNQINSLQEENNQTFENEELLEKLKEEKREQLENLNAELTEKNQIIKQMLTEKEKLESILILYLILER